MPSIINPINEQSFLLQLTALNFYWETFSGLSETTSTSEYSDGLSNRLYKLQGPRSLDDFTFTKAFDPVADKAIVSYWKNWCEGRTEKTTASIVPIRYCPTPEPLPGAPKLTLYGVFPISLQGWNVDKKSSNVSILTLVVSAEDWSYE
jgi:hypothetical protein